MERHLDRQDSDIEFQRHLPGCIWNMFHILDYHHWHSVKKMSPRRKQRRGKHATCFGNPNTVSFAHYTDEVQNHLDSDAVPSLDEQKTTKATPTDRISGKARIKALIAEEISARLRLLRTYSCHHLGASDGLGGISTDWTNPIIILQKSADPVTSGLQIPSLPRSSNESVTCNGKYHPSDVMRDEGCLKQHSLSAKQEFSRGNSDKLMNTSLNKNLSDGKQLDRGISSHQFMECVDVLELFKVNKKLFLEILQDPDVQAAKNFHVQLNSNREVRLKKSGSFPLADSPSTRLWRPSTIEHKQKEIWSFPKEENFLAGIKVPKSVEFKDSHDKPMGLKSDDTRVSAVALGTDHSSSVFYQGTHKHGWHESFVIHLKDVMKKIKHTLKESKKEDNHTSMNTILHGVPSRCKLSTDEKDAPVRFEEVTIQLDGKENSRSFHEAISSDNDLSKGQPPHIRRISSLNESVDRYARLFEFSLTKEAKWHDFKSKSLKLTNEDQSTSTGHSLKSFKRRLSLPDLEAFYPLPNGTSHNSIHSGIAVKPSVDYDINTKNESPNNLKSESVLVDRKQFEPPEAVEEADLQKNLVDEARGCEYKENSGDPTVGIEEEVPNVGEQHEDRVEREKQGCSPCEDQETDTIINFSNENEKQSSAYKSVLEEYFQDEIAVQTEDLVSKGCELDPALICNDEPNTSIDLEDRSSINSLTGCCSSADRENNENAYGVVGDHSVHFESNELDDNDFNYVRDVLEVSGFMEQGCLGTWHSLDQPLIPTLFKELESYLHHELECSSEDIGCNCDHQLLFDLINEVLIQIHRTSLAYFPEPFSFTQRLRLSPKGNHNLEEVWKRITWYRSTGLKMKQSLDNILARDIAKYDSWMNLQLDVGDIALDLEDLIFDELLNEVMH